MTLPSSLSVSSLRGRQVAHVALILDRSGSMNSCRDATISGFNEYTDKIRRVARDAGLRAQVTLTVFNDEVRMPLFQEPLERLHPLTRKLYVPDGSTRMLDGVGRTIDRLEQHGRDIEEASVLVCVISDGYENASREYSYDAVAGRIRRLTATDRWTFTYLGSNQDLSRVSEELSIPMANTAAYTSTESGTRDAWERHAHATSRRMVEMASGSRASRAFYAGQSDEERNTTDPDTPIR